ncbi:hypothetical protein HUU40_25015 [candidate division KSB1 bacterium]|nr:hypothetical protein [candidate division KSB1 bacterium]
MQQKLQAFAALQMADEQQPCLTFSPCSHLPAIAGNVPLKEIGIDTIDCNVDFVLRDAECPQIFLRLCTVSNETGGMLYQRPPQPGTQPPAATL